MFEIIEKRELAENIFLTRVKAPRIARSAQPGQFVIFFPKEFHSPIIGEGKIKKVVVKVKC